MNKVKGKFMIYNVPYLPFDFNIIEELDTDLMEIFRKSRELLEKFPEIRESIVRDQDIHGQKKKLIRNEVKRYNDVHINGNYYLFDCIEITEPVKLEKTGRERLKPELVLYFLIIRGLWGSISDHAAKQAIHDSISISAVLAHHSYKVPGSNTVRENLNAVSNKTRRLIMDSLSMLILLKGLDDFNEVYIDSTDVAANTAYPTDISVLYKLLDRVYRSFRFLTDEFGFPMLSDGWLDTRMKKLKSHLAFINMQIGKKGMKGNVKEKFKLFVSLADNIIKSFFDEQEKMLIKYETSDLTPDKSLALDRLWFKIDSDLNDAAYVLYYAELLVNENIKLPSREKILSISDPDAAFIQKGQRNPTIGYKPQIGRSRNGFISGFLLPKGNVSDSEMLVPTVMEVCRSTRVKPNLVSTDDGYASEDGVGILKNDLNILTVSINGAKGKKITSEDWDTTLYSEARRMRSAAESGMFTLKYRHSFGKMRRRGIEAVEAEQLEKIIAYNFIHMIKKEKKRLNQPDPI